jgi:hypothetical protein
MRKRRAYDDLDEEEEEEEEEEEWEEPNDVEAMSYQEIRFALSKRGIKAKGKKDALKAQLLELRQAQTEVEQNRLKHMARTASGVAAWTFALSDDVLLRHVLPQLDASSLNAFGGTCTAAYVLCNNDSLWESLSSKLKVSAAPTRKDKNAARTGVFAKARLPEICEQKLQYLFSKCQRSCTRCTKKFFTFLNTTKSCVHHDGYYREKNQWTEDEYLWSCCGAEEEGEPGCMIASHSVDPADQKGEWNGWW